MGMQICVTIVTIVTRGFNVLSGKDLSGDVKGDATCSGDAKGDAKLAR